MELQTQIDELKTSSKRQKIAIIALAGVLVFFVVKPKGVITCDGWRVVDKDGKVRIEAAGTDADGDTSVLWFDKDGTWRIAASILVNGDATVAWKDKSRLLSSGKPRVVVGTSNDGNAIVQWLDASGNLRINAGAFIGGNAGVQWLDNHGNLRIGAMTFYGGQVSLPTSDQK